MDAREEIDAALAKAKRLFEEVNALAEERSTDLRVGPFARMRDSAHSMVVNLTMARKLLDQPDK